MNPWITCQMSKALLKDINVLQIPLLFFKNWIKINMLISPLGRYLSIALLFLSVLAIFMFGKKDWTDYWRRKFFRGLPNHYIHWRIFLVNKTQSPFYSKERKGGNSHERIVSSRGFLLSAFLVLQVSIRRNRNHVMRRQVIRLGI